MELALFGPVKDEVTRDRLLSMQPQVRTECLALMRERGTSEKKIARIFGISRHAVSGIIDAKHLYNIPRAAEDRATPEDIPAPVLEKIDISRDALRLLRRIGRERHGLTAGKAAISAETGLYDKALEKAMAEVLDRGLVVKLNAGQRGQPACYCATPQGSAMLERAVAIVTAEA